MGDGSGLGVLVRGTAMVVDVWGGLVAVGILVGASGIAVGGTVGGSTVGAGSLEQAVAKPNSTAKRKDGRNRRAAVCTRASRGGVVGNINWQAAFAVKGSFQL